MSMVTMLSRWILCASRTNKLTYLQSYYACLKLQMCISVRLASVESLVKTTSMTPAMAKDVIHKYMLVRSMDEICLEETTNTIKELGMTSEDMHRHPKVLGIHAPSVVNYFELLRESGFTNITISDIINAKTLCKKSIKDLKIFGHIPNDLDVASHILSTIPGLPKRVAGNIRTKIGIMDEELVSPIFINQSVRFHYLTWFLSCEPSVIENIESKYYHLRYRALKVIIEFLDILIKELKFPKSYIIRHGFLLHGYPSVLRKTLSQMPTLAGVPIREVLFKNPRLMVLNPSTLQDTQNLLHELGFTDDVISRCFRVFTLSTATVRQRILQILSNPVFSCMRTHRRFLLLVLHHRLVEKRLNILQQTNMKCYSLQLLSGASTKTFERFISGQEDRTNGGDAVNVVSQVLECDSKNLREALNRHPHWHRIPVIAVYSTLVLLAERGFYINHIRLSVQILIYPTELVAKTLDSLTYEKPADAIDWSSRLKHNFTEDTKDILVPRVTKLPGKKYKEYSEYDINIDTSKSLSDSSTVEWQYVLPICLYLLEKNYHFTGDGVWADSKDDKEYIASMN